MWSLYQHRKYRAEVYIIQNFISLPPVSHQQAESVTESEGVVMNHPDIPKQNGNWSELYDKFPAEYNTTVRGTD